MVPVVIDTREQRPWAFNSEVVSVSRGTLTAGDYSLLGRESRVAIERKSLDDFVDTVIHGRDRFARELELLVGYDLAVVVIEANFEDVLAGRFSSRATPAAVVGAWLSLVHDYRIPAYFLSDRQHAQFAVERLLVRHYRRVVEPELVRERGLAAKVDTPDAGAAA